MIVLLKAVLANVTTLITQPMNTQPSQNGLQSSYQSEVNLRAGVGQRRPPNPQESASPPQSVPFDVRDMPLDELEALRQREITLKVVSGILLALLKWLKVSRKLLLPVQIDCAD